MVSAAEARLDAWIDRHCRCKTFIHCTDVNLFDETFCNRTDSIAGGWNWPNSRCEEHCFRDPAMRLEQERLGAEWYAECCQ